MPDQVRDDEVSVVVIARLLPPTLQNPFASSEVEMSLGLGLASLGVSTSPDTNGKRRAFAMPEALQNQRSSSYDLRLRASA
jgi:hypothetical protein